MTTENWYDLSAKNDPKGIVFGMDRKYGFSNYSSFYIREREKGLGESWAVFFPRLLGKKSINVKGQNVLVVGINDGQEYECIADQPSKLIGLDLARTALIKGKNTNNFKTSQFIQASADSLPIDNQSCQTAFCLRTYQVLSSEQKNKLLNELKRTTTGSVIISLPAGFLDIEKDKIIKGNIVSGSGENAVIDSEKPMRDAKELQKNLIQLGFENVEIESTEIEIFVFAKIK